MAKKFTFGIEATELEKFWYSLNEFAKDFEMQVSVIEHDPSANKHLKRKVQKLEKRLNTMLTVFDKIINREG
ncbi:MAG: hypothetical protein CMH63_00330 [Nanoarchaeota archaeon]|nr:hypothetical protein [Nanoarchaeota archaeon]|tara:strand:- start:10717 stop:10932 length:216 start_codon:yes stop_codon:yes gene_type:complete